MDRMVLKHEEADAAARERRSGAFDDEPIGALRVNLEDVDARERELRVAQIVQQQQAGTLHGRRRWLQGGEERRAKQRRAG